MAADSRLVSKVQLSTNKQSQTRHLFYLWHVAEIRRVVGGRNFLKQTRFLTSYSFLSPSYLCDAVLLLLFFSLSLSICFMWCSPSTALLLYIHIDIYVLYTLSSFCVFVVTFLYEFDFFCVSYGLHENAAFGNSVFKRCSRNIVIVLILKDRLLNKLIFIKSHCKGAVSLVAGQLPASTGISWWDTRTLQWQKILSWIVSEAQMVGQG